VPSLKFPRRKSCSITGKEVCSAAAVWLFWGFCCLFLECGKQSASIDWLTDGWSSLLFTSRHACTQLFVCRYAARDHEDDHAAVIFCATPRAPPLFVLCVLFHRPARIISAGRMRINPLCCRSRQNLILQSITPREINFGRFGAGRRIFKLCRPGAPVYRAAHTRI